MSAAPSEPEKYSIDEMMDRLKNPALENPEEGELVTRQDGTQAIRVRKRKRRSSQPRKEDAHRTKRARIVQVSAALILLFLTALAIGGAIVYANSRPYRDALLTKIAQASGATAQLEQFRMNPATANAGGLSLEWPAGNVLKSLLLRGLTAEISPTSFLGKSMAGEEVTVVTDGTLTLQVPTPGLPLRSTAQPAGDLPVRFNRYWIPVFHLAVGGSTPPAVSLTKSEASLYPENVNGRTQLRLNQGAVNIPGWPDLRLDRALLEFRGRDTDVIVIRLQHESDTRGSFELSGTIQPYKTDRPSTLAVQLDSFELAGLTGPSFARLFSGRVDTLPAAKSNFLSFLPTETPNPSLDIALGVSPTAKIEVKGFPFLPALAQVLDDPWFESPVFEGEASSTLHREGGIVSLQDLRFESKGRMALRGEIAMAANETLSGNLQLGVAEAMIISSKNPRLESMFGPTREGFRWLTLKIAGAAKAPTDNFRDLYTSAVVTAPAKAPAAEGDGSSFDELTRPK